MRLNKHLYRTITDLKGLELYMKENNLPPPDLFKEPLAGLYALQALLKKTKAKLNDE